MSGGDDWQAGDLALCVRGGPFPGFGGIEYPVSGRPYTVEQYLSEYPFANGKSAGLRLIDGPPNRIGNRTWNATRFRKIHPHTPDAEDRETIALLTGNPAKVEAHDKPSDDLINDHPDRFGVAVHGEAVEHD